MRTVAMLISGILMLSVVMAACSGGVSEEELLAVQNDLQQLESEVTSLRVEVNELEDRLSQVTLIAVALDMFTNPPEGLVEPDPQLIQEITALVETSQDLALQDKWTEIARAVFSSAGPPPLDLLGELSVAIQASGNEDVQEKFQEFTTAALRGQGAGPALELATLIQVSGDITVQEKMQQFVRVLVQDAVIPGELIEEFAALASENEEIQQRVQELAALPADFVEDFETTVTAIGNPVLDAQLEGLFTPGLGPGRHAQFLDSLVAALVDYASTRP